MSRNIAHTLIIFDCDGTLVDSEHLYNSITSELLNEIGYAEYTPELCLELFAGQSWSTIRHDLEERHNEPMPDDIIERYIRIANERLNHDFDATEHADTVLTQFGQSHKICVGSNGERNNVIKSLEVTGLLKHFDDERIFTKIQVEKPKPAPDLFFFACDQMQTPPTNALVIEDSPAGVAAARAANIDVIGFVGTSHAPDKQAIALKNAGAEIVIDSLIHIERHVRG